MKSVRHHICMRYYSNFVLTISREASWRSKMPNVLFDMRKLINPSLREEL